MTGRARGFTLLEMAIVLLILGLALAATVMPLNRMFQSSQLSANQERLDAAREALLTFAAVNGRLPCPDRTGDGREDQRAAADPPSFGCAGNIYEGFLPWATLGVQQTDYWGTRLRYRVSAEFTRRGNDPAWTCGSVAGQNVLGAALAGCTPGGAPSGCTTSAANPNSCTFEIADTGDIPVRDGQAGRAGTVFIMDPTITTPTGAVAVVLSHGSNKQGGTAQDGTVYPAPAAGTDEALNGPALGGITPGARGSANPFIMRPVLDNPASGCNDNSAAGLCYYDDQMVFLGTSTLVSRIVQSGLRLR